MLSSGPGRTRLAMLEGFPLVSRFTIPFSDVDMMQHVNNVAYIRWCEMVRVEHFARVIGEPINGPRGIIQANIMFTYERELQYREEIAIGVRVSRMGTKSYDYSYEIWSVTHGHRAAHGLTTVVGVNVVDRHTIEIPAEWRTKIDAFEQGPQQTFQ